MWLEKRCCNGRAQQSSDGLIAQARLSLGSFPARSHRWIPYAKSTLIRPWFATSTKGFIRGVHPSFPHLSPYEQQSFWMCNSQYSRLKWWTTSGQRLGFNSEVVYPFPAGIKFFPYWKIIKFSLFCALRSIGPIKLSVHEATTEVRYEEVSISDKMVFERKSTGIGYRSSS